MNRTEFMRRLAQALCDMPEEERRRALEYYENYFDEAGPENEAEVLRTLGAPEKVAADILRDFAESDSAQTDAKARAHETEQRAADGASRMKDRFQTMDSGQKLLVLMLVFVAVICVAPAGVAVVGGVGGILVALLSVVAAVFLIVPALDLAAWSCAIGFTIAAGYSAVSEPVVALCFGGIACICVALGVLLWQLTVYLFRTVFPALLRGIADFFRRLLGRS